MYFCFEFQLNCLWIESIEVVSLNVCGLHFNFSLQMSFIIIAERESVRVFFPFDDVFGSLFFIFSFDDDWVA